MDASASLFLSDENKKKGSGESSKGLRFKPKKSLYIKFYRSRVRALLGARFNKGPGSTCRPLHKITRASQRPDGTSVPIRPNHAQACSSALAGAACISPAAQNCGAGS